VNYFSLIEIKHLSNKYWFHYFAGIIYYFVVYLKNCDFWQQKVRHLEKKWPILIGYTILSIFHYFIFLMTVIFHINSISTLTPTNKLTITNFNFQKVLGRGSFGKVSLSNFLYIPIYFILNKLFLGDVGRIQIDSGSILCREKSQKRYNCRKWRCWVCFCRENRSAKWRSVSVFDQAFLLHPIPSKLKNNMVVVVLVLNIQFVIKYFRNIYFSLWNTTVEEI